MSKRTRTALLLVAIAIAIVLASVGLLAMALGPRSAPVIETTVIVPTVIVVP